jgi:hypothetical protein
MSVHRNAPTTVVARADGDGSKQVRLHNLVAGLVMDELPVVPVHLLNTTPK